MLSRAKKLLAAVLSAACIMTGAAEAFAAESPTQVPGKTVSTTVTVNASSGDQEYKTSAKHGTAKFYKLVKAKKTKVVVSASVSTNGVSYPVVAVSGNAFNKTSVKKVVLGTNVYKVYKNTFKGAKKLKYIYIRTTKRVKVSKGAFKGLNTKKMTIKINKKNKNYKKIVKALRKAGFKGKIKKYTYKKK